MIMASELPGFRIAPGRRMLLDGVSWGTYQSLLKDIGDRHIRLTFDCGKLEIMSPLPIHENVKSVIARLLEAYADAVGIDVECFGSTTLQREDLAKGIEPDECYYIQHAPQVIGKERFDLTIDPAPDLAIEIDIHPPDLARQPIYAALGVAEVWRYDGRGLVPLHRTDDGTYSASDRSLAFPDLSFVLLNQWLEVGLKQGQSKAVSQLRAWLAQK